MEYDDNNDNDDNDDNNNANNINHDNNKWSTLRVLMMIWSGLNNPH